MKKLTQVTTKKKRNIATIVFFFSNIAYSVFSWFAYIFWGITRPDSEKFPISPLWNNLILMGLFLLLIGEIFAHILLFKKVLYNNKRFFAVMCVVDALIYFFIFFVGIIEEITYNV
jgi:uncharacterized protein with PQ loop repeat